MGGRPIAVIIAALCALVALGAVGARVLSRDRDDLYEQFARDRAQGLATAARGLDRELADVREDLDLAAALLDTAEQTPIGERELDAIATIKREYLVMSASTPSGPTTVVALDAPAGVGALAAPALAQMLARANTIPGELHVSDELGPGPAAWYRVFARRPTRGGPAVAVVVDMEIVLARLELQREPATRVVVSSPEGILPAASDPQLAELVQREPETFAPSAGVVLSADEAASIGLARARAVVATQAVRVDRDAPWRILEVTSTTELAAQERTLVRRVLVGAALALALLIAATVYVVQTARRAAMLRERLRQADRLAHLTDKAEKILDHIPSGVLAISGDRRVTAANRRFVERFHDVTGRQLEAAFEGAPAQDLAVLRSLVDLATETRMTQSIHRAQFRLLGEEAYFSIHAVPLTKAIADVSTLVVFDDLTQQRRIEERLLRSEKLVTAGQLAAGIAHEIGTPLNVARARVELVMSRLGEQHAEAASHRIVLDQIDRVTRLIQQLLDYVRSVPAAMQRVDAAAALRAVSELLSPQASKRGVVLHTHVPDRMPLLRADPDQVQQILVNLVLNAIDACERGGAVELRAAVRDAAAVLEVTDDGHGIPHDIQAQVFDPFFTTKKRGQGTGLGLWVVAQLVRAHAAEIELDSAPGDGTTVRIAWPVAA